MVKKCFIIILLVGCAYTMCKHTNRVSPLSRVAHLHLIIDLFISFMGVLDNSVVVVLVVVVFFFLVYCL